MNVFPWLTNVQEIGLRGGLSPEPQASLLALALPREYFLAPKKQDPASSYRVVRGLV